MENSFHALCQSCQIRHLTNLEKISPRNFVKCGMFPYGNIGGIGSSTVPGINKQSLLKSKPENEHCYESNWAATRKERKGGGRVIVYRYLEKKRIQR